MTGYKDPPQHTRFQKGHSGNPNGRPKENSKPTGSSALSKLTLKVGDRLLKGRDGDEMREISAIEAVQNAQLKSAVGGNPLAQRDFLKRYEDASAERQRKIAEDCKFWSEYVQSGRLLIPAAQQKGEPEPKLLPHPDDIVIDESKGVTCDGPIDEEEEAEKAWIAKIRDTWIMQSVLDERIWARNPKSPHKKSGSLVFCFIINDRIYKRYRLSDIEIISRLMHYGHMPMRQILKETYRAWQAAGIPRKRGSTFVPLALVQRALEDPNSDWTM